MVGFSVGGGGMNSRASNRKRSRSSAGRVLGRIAREARERDRQRVLSRVDTDVLTVEGVADFLHCSVQAVRNVPEDVLPRYRGPGRRLLYLKEEVVNYVRHVRRNNPAADELVREIENDLLDSSSDSGRRRRERRNSDDQSS